MRVLNLGEIGGKIIVYGGPYSNLQAMTALLAEAARQGIPKRAVICTGDVVAYCADPVSTVKTVRQFGGPVVAGNCERQLADGADTCGCGFEEGSACDRLSAEWFSFASSRLGAEERAWMRDLPDAITFTTNGRLVAVVHGGASANNLFLWPTDPEAIFRKEINQLRAAVGDINVVIAGHCGLAFQRKIDGIDWINAGVIGMPPNDGHPETRFLLLDAEGARFASLRYDYRSAQSAMVAAGLSFDYAEALGSGYWPSQDILPEALRVSVAHRAGLPHSSASVSP